MAARTPRERRIACVVREHLAGYPLELVDVLAACVEAAGLAEVLATVGEITGNGGQRAFRPVHRLRIPYGDAMPAAGQIAANAPLDRTRAARAYRNAWRHAARQAPNTQAVVWVRSGPGRQGSGACPRENGERRKKEERQDAL